MSEPSIPIKMTCPECQGCINCEIDGHSHIITYRCQVGHTNHGPKQHFLRPSIDVLFTSAAAHYGQRVIGLILTGGGSDGTAGLSAITAHNGIALAQDPAEAQAPWMPRNALLHDHVERRVRLEEVLSIFTELTGSQSW